MNSEFLVSHHDPEMIGLSALIAFLASYAALDLAGRVTAARGGLRTAWLAGGAFAMGVGIWSMHYIGMLGLSIPVPVLYDPLTVFLSLLAAVFASAVALVVVSRQSMGHTQALLASLVMGAGISAMHYIGMAAMRLPARTQYNPAIVLLSVVIACVVSFVALRLAFRLRNDMAKGVILRKLLSALLMGAAILSMHYTGMAGVKFQVVGGTPIPNHGVDIDQLGIVAVAVCSILVLGLAMLTSLVDRRLGAHTEALAASRREVRAQQLFLRAVIDANPHLIFAKTAEGRYRLANTAFARVVGTTPAKLVGKTLEEIGWEGRHATENLADDREVIATGRPKFIPAQAITCRETGETLWLESVKVPLPSPDGSEVLALGVATDITQRRHLERQLSQTQKLEAVGLLAGGIAHDFNNVLTAIMGHTDLLQGEVEGTEPQAHLEVIMRAASRAQGLIQQLLAFGRRKVLSPRVLDLRSVVRDIEPLLRPLLGEDIEIAFETGSEPCLIEADPGQLEQVIMNLSVNARDAMPRGGKLRIATGRQQVSDQNSASHAAIPAGAYACLTVTDEGVGMNAETKSHMFEPFFTTKEQGKGTGLGLATVYGIVEQSGAQIRVRSEPGLGTTFLIYFPLTGQAKGPGPEAAPRPTGGSETVLVVEDEESVRQLTRRVLSSRGYEVISASRGDEAMRLAAAHGREINILVTDVVMPKMGGLELAQQLAPLHPGMKVLYVSGYNDDAVVRHGVTGSSVHFLQKPYAPDTLARKVREVLSAA